MLIPIRDVGKYGVIQDIPSYAAPFGAWTDAKNVEFRDTYVVKSGGYGTELSASVPPYHLTSVLSKNQTYFVYAGLNSVHAWSGSVQADITRVSGPYTGGEVDYWNGTIFNGLMVLNNGADVPQVWNPPSLSTKLVDLPNWPVGTTAAIIRSFKSYLIALGVTTSSLEDPRMIKWSTDAQPGTVPITWDPSDPTETAGENTLSGGTDRLVDCAELGRVNILYGESSTWVMQYTGYPYIFSFMKLYPSSGILAQGCVQPFINKHFVVTMNDIIVHSGGQVESIISHKLRKWLFKNLNPEAVGISRTARFDNHHEIWFAFPYGNTTVLNMALVWNWELNTWSIVELPEVQGIIGVPLVASAGNTWEIDTDTWAIASDPWGTPTMSRTYSGQLYMVSASRNKVYKTDDSYQFAGASFESMLEARGLDVAVAKDGSLFHDSDRHKLLTAVWPHISAPDGTQFTVEADGYDDPGHTPTWPVSGTWTVGDANPKVDLLAEGRYLAVRFRQTGSVEWRMVGFDLDVSYTGGL